MDAWSWISSLAAAGAVLVAVRWGRLRPARRLVTARGILDPSGRLGWIRWHEIEGAYHPSAGDRDGLRLRLRLSDRLRRRLGSVPPLDRAAVDFHIDLSGSGLTPAELILRIVAGSPRRPS